LPRAEDEVLAICLHRSAWAEEFYMVYLRLASGMSGG
jgi:hypothetical protein